MSQGWGEEVAKARLGSLLWSRWRPTPSLSWGETSEGLAESSPCQPPPAGQSQPAPSGCICGCRRAGGRRWRRPGWAASCGAGGGQPPHFPGVRHQKASQRVASVPDLAPPAGKTPGRMQESERGSIVAVLVYPSWLSK